MGGDADSAGRLTKEEEARGITAKGAHVGMGPIECGALVEQTEIGEAGNRLQPTEVAQAVVYGDHNNTVLGGELCPVVLVAVALNKVATVQKEEDRVGSSRRRSRSSGRPYRKDQTVFVARGLHRSRGLSWIRGLHAVDPGTGGAQAAARVWA